VVEAIRVGCIHFEPVGTIVHLLKKPSIARVTRCCIWAKCTHCLLVLDVPWPIISYKGLLFFKHDNKCLGIDATALGYFINDGSSRFIALPRVAITQATFRSYVRSSLSIIFEASIRRGVA